MRAFCHASSSAVDLGSIIMRRMKVAIVNLTSGGMSGGYRKYLRSLLPLLRRDPRISQLDVFMPSGLEVPDGGPVHFWDASKGPRTLSTLRTAVLEARPDVVFLPTARWIHCDGVPSVVMVRNMEPLTVPFGGNTFLESLRNLARARVARLACRRATRVIAVSEYVRTFLVDSWRVPPERVGVVYHGIAPADAGAAPAVLEGRSRFLFTAGSIRPARGLEDAIASMPAILRQHPDQSLVIAGAADASGKSYAARMKKLARDLGVERAVTWAGQLSPAEMASAYSRCDAFLVTSRAEACPNVALEAMSQGARIVSTSQDPMPEFFDGAALYYSPRDAAGLAAHVNALLASPADAAARAEAGAARAARFTWARTADHTIRELQKAAGIEA
jgi:glycosyltransferase involved in cell wall biosynthesis